MDDLRIGPIILGPLEYQQALTDAKAFEKEVRVIFDRAFRTSQGGKIHVPGFDTSAPEKDARKLTRTLDQIRDDRLKREQDAHALSFKNLTKQYEDHSKRVVDLNTKLGDLRKTGQHQLEASLTQEMLRDERDRTAILRKEMMARNDVMRMGGGAMFGMMGVGREIIGGSGVGALFNPEVLSIAGGLTAATVIAKDFGKAGFEAHERWENLRIGLQNTGTEISRLDHATDQLTDNTYNMANALGVDNHALQEATAHFLEMGNSQEDLERKQQAIIILAQKTGVTLEQAATYAVKGFSEDLNLKLSRFGIALDKNLPPAEQFNQFMAQSAKLLDGVKTKAQGMSGDIARATNEWNRFKDQGGIALIQFVQPAIKGFNLLAQGQLKQSDAQMRYNEAIESGKIPQEDFIDRLRKIAYLATGHIAEVQQLNDKYHKQVKASEKSSDAKEKETEKTKELTEAEKHAVKAKEEDTAAAAKEAAKIGFLTSEYQRLKEVMDGFDTKRTRLEMLKQQGADILDNVSNYITSPAYNAALIKNIQTQIHAEGAALESHNKNLKKMEGFDPSIEHGEGKGKSEETLFKEKYNKQKDLLLAHLKKQQELEDHYVVLGYQTDQEAELNKLDLKKHFSIELSKINAGGYANLIDEQAGFNTDAAEADKKHYDILKKNAFDNLKALIKMQADTNTTQLQDIQNSSKKTTEQYKKQFEAAKENLHAIIEELSEKEKEVKPFIDSIDSAFQSMFDTGRAQSFWETLGSGLKNFASKMLAEKATLGIFSALTGEKGDMWDIALKAFGKKTDNEKHYEKLQKLTVDSTEITIDANSVNINGSPLEVKGGDNGGGQSADIIGQLGSGQGIGFGLGMGNGFDPYGLTKEQKSALIKKAAEQQIFQTPEQADETLRKESKKAIKQGYKKWQDPEFKEVIESVKGIVESTDTTREGFEIGGDVLKDLRAGGGFKALRHLKNLKMLGTGFDPFSFGEGENPGVDLNGNVVGGNKGLNIWGDTDLAEIGKKIGGGIASTGDTIGNAISSGLSFLTGGKGSNPISAILGLLPLIGLEDGGFTGYGNHDEPKGIVHAEEGVLNAKEVKAIGGKKGFESLQKAIRRGYRTGGFVDGYTTTGTNPVHMGNPYTTTGTNPYTTTGFNPIHLRGNGGGASQASIDALHNTMRSIDKKMDQRIVIDQYNNRIGQYQNINQMNAGVL